MIEDLVALYACQPRVRLQSMPLTGIEDPVSPMALRHMRMCDALIGPYRPCRPLLLSVWGRIFNSIFNR